MIRDVTPPSEPDATPPSEPRRPPKADVQEVAVTLRWLLDQVDAGRMGAPAHYIARLEGVLLVLEQMAEEALGDDRASWREEDVPNRRTTNPR